MSLEWHPGAVEEFLELEPDKQEYLNREIKKLPEKGLEWSKIGRVKRDRVNLDVYRLKVDPDNVPDINHRVLFDVTRDSHFKILKIGCRPDFYGLDNLEKASKRL